MSETGKIAEYLLASLVSEPLLKDFVHLRPEYIKRNRPKELCDLLVDDEPNAIIIQLKTQDLNKAKGDRDPLRWAKKEIVEASRQVFGAIRRIGISEISTFNPVRGNIKFPIGRLRPFHGLVILDYKSSPFKIDDILPRRTKKGIPIHYISYNDFILLCKNLMTLPDLIAYLNERAKIPSWATPLINNEKDTYAYYITHNSFFKSSICIEDFENQWRNLTLNFNDQYINKIEEDKLTEIFSSILNAMYDKDPLVKQIFPISKETISMRNDLRVEATRKLNYLRRLHRREISKKIIEIMELADSSKIGRHYFAFRSEDSTIFYVFLASRHSRDKRIEELSVISYCLKYNRSKLYYRNCYRKLENS